jgi:hypothetical protein
VDKTTAQQPKVQQFESTEFQDPQAAATAETPGIQYQSVRGRSYEDIYIYIYYYKFFGGKKFLAICTPLPNAIFNSNNSKLAHGLLLTKNFEMWCTRNTFAKNCTRHICVITQ